MIDQAFAQFRDLFKYFGVFFGAMVEQGPHYFF